MSTSSVSHFCYNINTILYCDVGHDDRRTSLKNVKGDSSKKEVLNLSRIELKKPSLGKTWPPGSEKTLNKTNLTSIILGGLDNLRHICQGIIQSYNYLYTVGKGACDVVQAEAPSNCYGVEVDRLDEVGQHGSLYP